MNKCAVILLLASVASAQTRPEKGIYEFKNVSVQRASEISNFVQQLMDGKITVFLDASFKTAIIRANSGTADDIIRASTLLQRYDVAAPAPAFDFVAYLVRASTRAAKDVPAGPPVPPVLQEVIAEMKKTFAYGDYTLLDTIETGLPGANSRNGAHQAHVESMLPPGRETLGPVPYFYEIEYGDTYLSTDLKSVHVSPFKFTVRIPVQSATTTQYQNSGITTDVEIREGQKLVLGKVRTGFSDPSDVFLILTVKLR
jgi:hypothetical protein